MSIGVACLVRGGSGRCMPDRLGWSSLLRKEHRDE